MGLGVADRRDELQTWIRSVVSQHDAPEIGLWSVVIRRDATYSNLRYVATPLDAPHATKKASEVNFLRGLSYSYFPYSPNIKPGIALISNSLKSLSAYI